MTVKKIANAEVRKQMARAFITELGGYTRTAKFFRVTQPAVSLWTTRGLPARVEEVGRLKWAWLSVWQQFKEYEGLNESETPSSLTED
jgi:predicted transcriptional regulator